MRAISHHLTVAIVINGQQHPRKRSRPPAERHAHGRLEPIRAIRRAAPVEMTEHYANIEPSRADVDALEGPVLLEFGTAWCGHCRAAQPLIGKALADRSGITHLKIEDGPGRPLGRSFRVKLWPTLILLSKGQELGRVVRPQDLRAIEQALGAAGRG
ncbi:probable thioredoxin [Stutzerimonas stutzeri A1501]|uniref:Probable thioredoxin n=1 Tax=Stutzerimonas stutzeri (strain A1501) TaxID=379731 RepID=A4VND2_STUS1|nr:probable thioredoxin [Stutzerimonas stutzeri A1501]